MKKLLSKMKILLVLAICAGMMVPAVAFAGEVPNPLVTDMKLTRGSHTLPGEYVRSSRSIRLNENITKLVFEVDNGEPSGKKRVSSVKIDLLDEKGKKRAAAISPAQFNQNMEFSNVVGTLGKDDISGLTELNVAIKVGGPKNSFIVLNVTEYYEEDVDVCPYPPSDPRYMTDPRCITF